MNAPRQSPHLAAPQTRACSDIRGNLRRSTSSTSGMHLAVPSFSLYKTTINLYIPFIEVNRNSSVISSSLAPSPNMDRLTSTRRTPNLLDLPVEIRHCIYSYLFLHRDPIWMGTRYIGLRFGEANDPVFCTTFFRVSKKAHLDAISYAYGSNQIVLKDTFEAFTSLSSTALASIENLTVVHTSWTEENASEGRAWTCLKAKCSGLKILEVELHSDLLLQSVRHLADFFALIPSNEHRPGMVLDIYVWARHFDFDGGTRDYSRSLQMLRGGHRKTPSTPTLADPRTRVLRLPSKARSIVLCADMNAATLQALDAFLDDHDEIPLVKTTEHLPTTGRRAIGRTDHFCYTWTEATA